jgi:hypothetical protein
MFQDELSNKVSEIRRRALDEYDRWLRQNLAEITTESGTAFYSLSLNEARTAVVVPPAVRQDAERYITEFETYLSDLDRLEERFQRYAELSASSLDDVRGLLSPLGETALGDLLGQWGQPGSIPGGSSATGKIAHATSSIVTPMSDPDTDTVDVEVYGAGIWGGAAARSFNDNFLSPFSEYSARQVFCLIYLADVVQMVRNTAKDTQDDLLTIADECILALKGEGRGGPPVSALTVLSVLANVASLVAPGGWGRVLSVGSMALDVASRFHHLEDPPEWGIPSLGFWHHHAIHPAHDHLTTMEQRLTELDDQIGGAILEDAASTFYSPSFRLKSERPDPPNAITPSVEGPVDPPDDMFVADIRAVYLYGHVTFPEAADEYGAAAGKLDRCELPQWVNVILSRSAGEFALARACVLPALGATQDHLIHAGTELVAICNDYEWQDEANAATFEQFKGDLETDLQSLDRPVYEYPTSLADEKLSRS